MKLANTLDNLLETNIPDLSNIASVLKFMLNVKKKLNKGKLEPSEELADNIERAQTVALTAGAKQRKQFNKLNDEIERGIDKILDKILMKDLIKVHSIAVKTLKTNPIFKVDKLRRGSRIVNFSGGKVDGFIQPPTPIVSNEYRISLSKSNSGLQAAGKSFEFKDEKVFKNWLVKFAKAPRDFYKVFPSPKRAFELKDLTKLNMTNMNIKEREKVLKKMFGTLSLHKRGGFGDSFTADWTQKIKKFGFKLIKTTSDRDPAGDWFSNRQIYKDKFGNIVNISNRFGPTKADNSFDVFVKAGTNKSKDPTDENLCSQIERLIR